MYIITVGSSENSNSYHYMYKAHYKLHKMYGIWLIIYYSNNHTLPTRLKFNYGKSSYLDPDHTYSIRWNQIDYDCVYRDIWFVGINGKRPDSKIYGANMGPTWVLSAQDGPHVGPMNLSIRAAMDHQKGYFPLKPTIAMDIAPMRTDGRFLCRSWTGINCI